MRVKLLHIKKILLPAALAVLMAAFLYSGTALAGTAVIKGSVVNIREGPGTQYAIAGNLYQDTEVNVLEEKNGWYRISVKSLSGWVSATLLELHKEIQVEVVKDIVNLRSGPGTGYALAGQAVRGELLALLDVEGEWYKVKTGKGTTCYIASSLVKEKAASENAPGTAPQVIGKIQVNNGPINARLGPGTNYDKAGMLEDKAVYQVLGEEGDWYKILFSGKSAYVAKWLVSRVEGFGEKPVGEQPVQKPDSPPVVILNQQQLSFEVPPIIENDRTLVPLRAIFEAMGAVVEWNNDSRTVIARKSGTTVVLPIGSTKPTVNGKEWLLDVPAKIVQDRTLAPLRFVGEAFGGTVTWDGDSRTVNISSSGKTEQVQAVKVNGNAVNLRSGPGTTYDRVALVDPGEKLPVLAEKDGWYQVSRGGRTAWVASWVVDVAEEAGSNSGSEPPNSSNPVFPEKKVWFTTASDKNEFKVIIDAEAPLFKNIDKGDGYITYTYPGRRVQSTDRMTVAIGSGTLVIQGENAGSNAVVKVTLPAGVKYQISTQGEKDVLSISNRIVRVSRKVNGNTGDSIIIYTLCPGDFESSLNNGILEVQLKSTAMGDDRELYEYKVSPVLEKMTVTETGSDDPLTTLRIETKNLGDYSVFWTEDDNALNILLSTEKRRSEFNENLVILDPGHGGSDPGASGSYLKEKNVNLDIALKVGRLLEQKGYDVKYTRNTDVYYSKEERAVIANQMNGAVFVSIHNNAVEAPDKQGTETYYYAPIEEPELFMQKAGRSRLANYLQENLLKYLKRNNRGVKQKGYTVLTDTIMPSALVEIVFISNPEEEALLQQGYFKELAAEAIADAIDRYMRSR